MECPVVVHESEAAARLRIDRELTASGWDIENPAQVKLEQRAASGRLDYLLRDDLGRPVCVVEAKRDALSIPAAKGVQQSE